MVTRRLLMTKTQADSTITAADFQALLDIMGEIRQEQRAIRALLETKRARTRTLTASDKETLSQILHAVAGKRGSGFFTVHQVKSDNVLKKLAPMTARRLGKLLSRSIGTNIDGLSVERNSTENGAIVWQVFKGLS